MFDVNVKAVYFAAQAAARRMVPRHSGVIINLSSIAGIRGAAGFVTYCASKGAVRFMSMALASELGPSGIRVCSIHPGLIDTSMTTADVPILGGVAGDAMTRTIGLGRPGTPDDVAGGIVLLASDLAGYVTGASLLIDGGMMYT
jgi:NAD(P)-dependent dehydrogenase (short-subunit alcohol dehydrogenase family)